MNGNGDWRYWPVENRSIPWDTFGAISEIGIQMWQQVKDGDIRELYHLEPSC